MTFSFRTKGAAVLAGVLGAGAIVIAPAAAEPLDGSLLLADNHVSSDMQMENMQAEEQMSAMTIADVAASNESFSTLEQALGAANLTSTLAGTGPYTVFAPTDEAFNQLPEGALEFLLQPENEDLLSQVLTYHVVSGEVTSDQLSTGVVDSLGGGLSVGVFDSGVVINNASVIDADVQASNGVVHVVNRVLIPEPLQQKLAAQLGLSDIY